MLRFTLAAFLASASGDFQSDVALRRATDADGECMREVITTKTVQVPCTRNTYKRRLEDWVQTVNTTKKVQVPCTRDNDRVLRRLMDGGDNYDDCIRKVHSFKTVQVPCTRNRYTVD